jgi:hypothetical protein
VLRKVKKISIFLITVAPAHVLTQQVTVTRMAIHSVPVRSNPRITKILVAMPGLHPSRNAVKPQPRCVPGKDSKQRTCRPLRTKMGIPVQSIALSDVNKVVTGTKFADWPDVLMKTPWVPTKNTRMALDTVAKT